MAQGTHAQGNGEEAAYEAWLSEMVTALLPVKRETVMSLHCVRRALGLPDPAA